MRILIVDDSVTTRCIIKRVIQMAQLPVEKVLEAENGTQALTLLASEPVDLLLLDLHMPQMNGVELAGRILADERLRHTAIVIISADPNDARIEQLKRDGVRGHLRKPFTAEALRNLVNQTLGVSHV